MSEYRPTVGYRRNGLYYPYFHVRDERWLKVAALYWPRIVRIVPDHYPTRDSDTVSALAAENFIVRHPPGSSVQAIAPRFIDLAIKYAKTLHSRFRVTPDQANQWWERWISPSLVPTSFPSAPEEGEKRPRRNYMHRGLELTSREWLTGVHASEMTPEARDALIDAQLAVRGPDLPGKTGYRGQIGGVWSGRHYPLIPGDEPPWGVDDWVMMHPRLVGIYTSILAENFALANNLQPTTDQDDAYATVNDWTADRIAAALLGRSEKPGLRLRGGLPETLGYLALELIIPRNLDSLPVSKIVDIRNRHSAEFFAFGQAIDEAAASLASLSDIRDDAMLDDYLRQVVAARFAGPLMELRAKIKHLTGDAAAMSVNVKTQLPTAVAAAGGAWLTGKPLVAGTAGLAVGLIGIRRQVREQLEEALKYDRASSFLLHTGEYIPPKTLLRRTLNSVARIAGTNVS